MPTENTSPIYLDYMASTPIDPQVIVAMLPYMSSLYGNPASKHHYGVVANEAIETARAQVAEAIHAPASQIYFTAGATEASNIALTGAAHFYQRSGKHIITTSIEHVATLNTCKALEKSGFDITYLTPDAQGMIHPEAVQAALRPDTILVSICHVHNEIGVIQDIASIAHIVAQSGALLHVDAAQSIGKAPLDVQHLPISMLSLSAHKCFGPKGVGALYLRAAPRIHLHAILHGGGQEHHIRPGTLATHQIVGMGAAYAKMHHGFEAHFAVVKARYEQLLSGILTIPGANINGALDRRVPHNLSVYFTDIDGKTLHQTLAPICAVSSGSACNAHEIKTSHVLRAIGRSTVEANATIRFSLSHCTTEAEIAQTIQALTQVVERLRT